MLKKYFITGMVILLPLTVTIFVVIFLVNFLTHPFMGLVSKLLASTLLKNISFGVLSPEQLTRHVSQIFILLGLFLATVGLGFFARWFFFKTLIKLSDKILHKIPLINKVYKTTQEIIKTFFITDKGSFKQVVMVPFPTPETYSIGLVSRSAPKSCQDALQGDLVSVFVPTTPNPTTGFLLMFKKEDLVYLDIKTEDAIKYVVSCGVIIPPGTQEDQDNA